MTPFNSVLIVDDEPAIRDLLARWVESSGLQARTASNAEEAVATMHNGPCDLAIIDVVMPGKNGLWLAGELMRDHPETAVVLATGNATTVDAAAPPVADFLIKPFKRDRFVLALDRGREWRRQAVQEIEWHEQLSQEVRRSVVDVQDLVKQARALGQDEADALSHLAHQQMPDVQEHSERVVRFAVSIAQELGLNVGELQMFEHAARFHDIGKLAMPKAVLTKPSPLTLGEALIMRRHVDAGRDILLSTQTLEGAAPTVYASHEWFGGTGYPRRLEGTAIPLESRIIAVADAYDAMTQDRCYRSLLGSTEAATELLRFTPTQFDPVIVTAFLALLARH
jgi:response regulator RpfG family c-di-GMP phosphodiesterase